MLTGLTSHNGRDSMRWHMHCPEEGLKQVSEISTGGVAGLQREAPERVRGWKCGARTQDTAPAYPPPPGVLRRTHTRSKVGCHLLKCSSSQEDAPHQARKPREGQGGDTENASSHAFPLPTSHSHPGCTSKPIQEKPAEQCTLPVPS